MCFCALIAQGEVKELPNGHSINDSQRPADYNGTESRREDASLWVESRFVRSPSSPEPPALMLSLQDHHDDSKSDLTQVSQLNDGKFSLLQFALFNFRESLDK